jgi:hypothetical protein
VTRSETHPRRATATGVDAAALAKSKKINGEQSEIQIVGKSATTPTLCTPQARRYRRACAARASHSRATTYRVISVSNEPRPIGVSVLVKESGAILLLEESVRSKHAVALLPKG